MKTVLNALPLLDTNGHVEESAPGYDGKERKFERSTKKGTGEKG